MLSTRPLNPVRAALLVVTALAMLVLPVAPASAQFANPSLSLDVAPTSIGSGSTSRMTLTITNDTEAPIQDEDAEIDLDPDVTIQHPASATTTCTNGVLSAPSGGGLVVLDGYDLADGATCTVSLDVTATVAGGHTSTASNGNPPPERAGFAGISLNQAELTVETDRPGVTKQFLTIADVEDRGGPSTTEIAQGEDAYLLINLDNTLNGANALNVTVVDPLPAGLVVSDYPDTGNSCAGLWAPEPGDTSVSLVLATVNAGSTCTASVRVTAQAAGDLVNRTDPATSSNGGQEIGFAVAGLDVEARPFRKAFLTNPVAPGGVADLRFTIQNTAGASIAEGTFTDDFDAMRTGAVPTGELPSNPCGLGSTLSVVGSVLTLEDANLPFPGSCSFTVQVQLPGSEPVTAEYTNTTATYTAVTTADGGGGRDEPPGPITPFAPAEDRLVIGYVPLLDKSFDPTTTGAGGSTTMTFTVTNPDPDNGMTDIAFDDVIASFVDGATVADLPANPCGGGSVFTVTNGDPYTVGLFSGSLPAGGDCTFDVTLEIPEGVGGGDYLNRTEQVSATLGGDTVYGAPATASLQLYPGPSALVAIIDDPVLAGDPATLQIDLSYGNDGAGLPDASGIATSIELGGLTGLDATGLPDTDACGPANGTLEVIGTTLQLSGVTLTEGDSCQLQVTLDVPASAKPGAYPLTATAPTATVGGTAVVGTGGTDDLDIAGVTVDKEFLFLPALPGGTSLMRFTISNVSASTTFQDIQFTDDVAEDLSGVTFSDTTTRNDICGTGSSMAFVGSTLSFSGGNLAAGGQCVIDVQIQIPGLAAEDTYRNRTSPISYSDGSEGFTAPRAIAQFPVTSTLVQLDKTFTGYPVRGGDQLTLEFALGNLSPTRSLEDITFTDDLDAALTGLASVSGTVADVCGAGSQISGTSTLTLTGASLPAGGSCTFSVTVELPGGLPSGGTFTNTTSAVSATALPDAVTVSGDPATDDLVVSGQVAFSKAFDDPTFPGNTVELVYTIDNDDPGAGLADVQFTDDLDGALSGLVATTLPTEPCGAGSTLTGSSLLTLAGGQLGADASCTFQVTLAVPDGATPGSYPSASSELRSAGVPIGSTAEDTLEVEPPPVFTKAFAPDSILQQGTTTVTWTIDNSASSLAATDLDFTDTLLAGLEVADPANAATSCTGGTLTAAPGATTVAYTGGTVPALGTCTVTVDLLGTIGGIYVDESGALTSSSGDSGTAVDTLLVATAPSLAKSFSPTAVQAGGTSTLSLTIDNTANGAAVAITDLTDNLPAGMTVAATPDVASSCMGGTVTAVAGSSTITYTGTAQGAATCQIDVDVTVGAVGSYVNTTEPLVTGNGTSGATTATLTGASVPAPAPRADLAVTIAPTSTEVAPDEDADLVVTVTNNGPDAARGELTIGVTDPATITDVVGCDLVDGACTIPTLAPGGTAAVTLTTAHPTLGTDEVTATIDGAAIDDTPDNDTASATVTVREVPGTTPTDLIDAAIQTSRERFPSTRFAGTVEPARFAVISRVDVFADSLAGSVLTDDGPLLFTDPMSLDPGTANEVNRVLGGPGTVYLLGGPAALSAEVETALAAHGHTVTRLFGPSRIETAIAVADEARAVYGGTGVGIARAFGVDGDETAAWADSVAGGGWAAATHTPILFTPTDSLHPAVEAWYLANVDEGGATVLGGTAAISEAVAQQLSPVTRVAGAERGGTAVEIARQLRGVQPEGARSYILVNGFADVGWAYGLIAAGPSADDGAPVLVTNTASAPPSTVAEVSGCGDQVDLTRISPSSLLTDELLGELDALDRDPCEGGDGDGEGTETAGGGTDTTGGSTGGGDAPDQDQP